MPSVNSLTLDRLITSGADGSPHEAVRGEIKKKCRDGKIYGGVHSDVHFTRLSEKILRTGTDVLCLTYGRR